MQGTLASGLRSHPIGFGITLSLLSVLASGALGAALYFTLGREGIGRSAAERLLSTSGSWLFLWAVVVIPAIETAIGQLAPIEVLRKFGAPWGVLVAVSALSFGFGHFLQGGIGHGLTTVASGAVFAVAYLSFRTKSVKHAYACAWACHASHNFLLLFVLWPLAVALLSDA
jgi:hypothetical protein